jgi:hypothetical protein
VKLSGTVAELSSIPSLMADLIVDDDAESTADSETEEYHPAGKCTVVVLSPVYTFNTGLG